MKKKNLITTILRSACSLIIIFIFIIALSIFKDKLSGGFKDIVDFILSFGILTYLAPVGIVIAAALVHIIQNNSNVNKILSTDTITDEQLLEDYKQSKKTPLKYRVSDKYVYVKKPEGISVFKKDDIKTIEIKEISKIKGVSGNESDMVVSPSQEKFSYYVIIKMKNKTWKHKVKSAEKARRIRDCF